jgi:hypothetical protein
MDSPPESSSDVVIARKVIISARKTKSKSRPAIKATKQIFDSDDDFQ